MKLRNYQTAAISAIKHEWEVEKRKKTLLVLPTGCGKTIVFTTIAKDEKEHGRVLILAHRGELLEQAADKLQKAWGLSSALEKAESTCLSYPEEMIVVGSVQTLQSEKRLQRFPKDFFRTIIIDEAHHALSQGYQNVLNYFDSANVLGVTATPDRGDMKSLGQVFESLAYEYTLPQAVREGFLVPLRAVTIPLNLDLSNVSMQSGDFKASEVGDALDPYLEQIAVEMKEYCKDRKTVVFLPLVSTSQKFCSILNERGFRACEVNGNSKDRQEVIDAFAAGEFDVMCNSMLLTEGWDCPSVDCVIVLRPTKVRGLYSQMIGRGTRLSPETGKKDCLILDFLWHTERHELCRPADIVCKDKEIADRITKKLEEQAKDAEALGDWYTQESMDLLEEEQVEIKNAAADREASLAKQLAEMRMRKKKFVDPLQFEMSIGAEDLTDYVPTFGWESKAPSQKQLDAIEKFGIDSSTIDSAGKASKYLDRLMKRAKDGLSTAKQIRFLEGRGFKNVGQWTKDEASKMTSRIQANGWRVPYDITPQEYIPASLRNPVKEEPAAMPQFNFSFGGAPQSAGYSFTW